MVKVGVAGFSCLACGAIILGFTESERRSGLVAIPRCPAFYATNDNYVCEGRMVTMESRALLEFLQSDWQSGWKVETVDGLKR